MSDNMMVSASIRQRGRSSGRTYVYGGSLETRDTPSRVRIKNVLGRGHHGRRLSQQRAGPIRP